MRRTRERKMMERLTKTSDMEDARRRLEELLDSSGEWFCTEGRGRASRVELRRGEWEVRAERGAVRLSYWGEAGLRVWRVAAWEWTGARLRVEATRRAGALRSTLELTPRASAGAAGATVAAAREAACERLAALACAHLVGARVESVRLSAGARRGEPGRYARVILQTGGGLRTRDGRVAATGPVVALGPEEADAFLASALLWFMGLGAKGSERGSREKESATRGAVRPPHRLLLMSPRALLEATGERVALLREGLRDAIEVCEVDEDGHTLTPSRVPTLDELLDVAPRFVRPPPAALSETASRILSLAPEAIDVVRARHGETLRFRGLAFARVRRLMNEERAWFGVGASPRRTLDRQSWPDFLKLLEELSEHRRADAPDRRHALYRASPEAWLESLLRRDVTRLDPGLRLAPLHTQLRTTHMRSAGARPLDLLALRRDGRLVVVELKVSGDTALPLQGADYWRRIRAHQLAGHLTRARLFGDAEISDSPPLVYLAAPLLSFHRSFETLARSVAPEIEIYRFDLNEDWRAGVRVARLCHVNQQVEPRQETKEQTAC